MTMSASAVRASRMACRSSRTRPENRRRRRRARLVPPASARWRRQYEPRRPRAGGQQLVAGDDEAHARPPHHADLTVTDRAEDADILRTQHAPRLEDGRPMRDVFPAPADVLARRNGRKRLNPRADRARVRRTRPAARRRHRLESARRSSPAPPRRDESIHRTGAPASSRR